MNRIKLIFVVLLALVVCSSLSVVYARHSSRVLFAQLQEEKGARDDLIIQYGQLQLEKSAWATHGRVERLARTKLKMRMPDQRSVVLIQQ